MGTTKEDNVIKNVLTQSSFDYCKTDKNETKSVQHISPLLIFYPVLLQNSRFVTLNQKY